LRQRLTLARLNARATDIRLRIPEAFRVHQKVLDWDRDLSPTGIPAKAVGLDAMTLRIMRWGFGDWRRLKRLNSMPGATSPTILQMDYLPAFNSAALFTISSTVPLGADRPDAETLLRFGCALQRFWLTAEVHGISLQPALATLIFAHYGRQGITFTDDPGVRAKAKGLADVLQRRLPGAENWVFIGRIGHRERRAPHPRSVRRPLAELTLSKDSASFAETEQPVHRPGAS
jgi:hypothetical protein